MAEFVIIILAYVQLDTKVNHVNNKNVFLIVMEMEHVKITNVSVLMDFLAQIAH